MNKVLFVTSEAHPLIKTGGLADVSGSLPAALRDLGQDVRILLPGYRSVKERMGELTPIAQTWMAGAPEVVRILEGRMPDTGVTVWLVDSPAHFDRDGGPYADRHGHDWADNAWRFALFGRVAVQVALDRVGLSWRPEMVHCNDWQSGLVPALLARETHRPATVFTIHNLAYQGLFPWATFADLHLPPDLWSLHAMEFHNHFSFIKGGLVFADFLTTVSPTYAREIRTPDFGYGLEGLLSHRADRLVGILNGADYQHWDPSRDPHIPSRYDHHTLEHKAQNKRALQERFGLRQDACTPLIGMVGRLVHQKGYDLVLAALPTLMYRGVQVALLGSGERHLEHGFSDHAARYSGQCGVHIGYDESLAHLIEAGADMFLMPSRFEPCGLNQIYSLRYGTPPLVRRTGGLADTVADTTDRALAEGTATGFVFEHADVNGLMYAVDRALSFFPDRGCWNAIARAGMGQDFSWDRSARQYLDLYERARRERF